MTGKSQLTNLQCCKIPKNIGSCSLGGMGLSEPVSVLRRGKRKVRLLASMGLQMRDIQVLCLVLMVVAAPFLWCAAAVAGGMVPRTRMATPAAGNESLVILTNCFPSVILGGLRNTYTCEVNNAQPLIGLNLVASFSPVPFSQWPVTLEAESNKMTFTASPEIALENRGELVIEERRDILSGATPVTTSVSMDFMIFGDAKANFNGLHPYYGMSASFAPNLPSGTTASDYMLVRSFNDCRYTTTTCTDTVGCYRIVPPGHLPPPDNYWLCVTSNGWNDKYLPWGVNSLEVKLLFATPPYLAAGKDKNVVLRDGESVVSRPGRVFLAWCPGNDCPIVTTGRWAGVLHRDACVNPPVSSRVYLSDEHVLFAESGVYAVCAEGGDGGYTAPTALRITVLQTPFAFKITADTDRNTVTINVSGGDLDWRREPYTVCAVPESDTCYSLSAPILMCGSSESADSPSIFLNITESGMLVKDVRFCFVTSFYFIGGSIYGQMFDLSEETEETGGKEKKKLSAGVIAGIVIAGIVLLTVGVAVFYFCYWRRRPSAGRGGDYPSASVLGHPTKRRSYPVGNSRVTPREGDDGNSRSIGEYPSLFLPSEVDNPMSDRQTGESTFPNVGSTGPQYHDGYSDAMTSTSFAPHGSGYTSQSYA
ncbi:hypothetical protein DQ04_13071000 [Trypanosoma grayi]|uniref:hypothetical protein n=1 Tax=Trypanosoma grayi TaxID=71804 RepID=UPI0004F44E37|nr:hypothetical protein DQ04_13071000 [Trypanosoma grayi]KEG06609.1 hypothetical protein DQ04_13071000 [Trypanosoma grayi]